MNRVFAILCAIASIVCIYYAVCYSDQGEEFAHKFMMVLSAGFGITSLVCLTGK
jgi:hypothetical protein